MDKETKELYQQYIKNGLAIGGTAAGLTGLWRYLRSQLLTQPSSQEDDGTMYIYKASAADDDSSGFEYALNTGGAIASGAAAALGSYYLGNKLMNWLRQREAQQELDAAQELFLNAEGYKKLDKKASNDRELTFAGKTLSGATALSALLTLGSAAATYSYLNSKYPIKKPTVKGPTRFKIVQNPESMPSSTDGAYEDTPIKYASADDSMFMVTHMLHSMHKQASLASNVIATVADGRAEAFEKTVGEIGFEQALNTVKGASAIQTKPMADALAIQYCTKEASFSPVFNLLVASEFAAFNPELMKQASNLDDITLNRVNSFTKLASLCIQNDVCIEMGVDTKDLELDKVPEQVKSASTLLNNCIIKLAASPLADNSIVYSTDDDDQAGTADASKKDKEVIHEEAKAYTANKDNTTQSVTSDPIDSVIQGEGTQREQTNSTPTSDKVNPGKSMKSINDMLNKKN